MTDAANTTEKLRALERRLQEAGRVAVAFSGGTDSTFLLAFAQNALGGQALAITVRSSLMPDADLTFAQTFCEARAIPQVILDVDPLTSEDVRANSPKRCYHCKRLIMAAVANAAHERGALPCDGSNADDALDYRPGTQAVRELGIASPLAEVGLTKQEIRTAARALGLANWNMPAAACLASRIPYGTLLEAAALDAVARAEAALRAEGFAQVRVRAHGNLARVELPKADIARAVSEPLRERITDILHDAGFAYHTLDLDGYRMGSLNEEILEVHP